MYLVNVSMPLKLETPSVFSTPFRSKCGCVLCIQKTSPYHFFHFWDRVWVTHYLLFLSHSAMFTIYFLHHSTDIYYSEPSTVLFSLLHNSKTQKMRRKKRKNLRKSPPFIKAKRASGLCKHSKMGSEYPL